MDLHQIALCEHQLLELNREQLQELIFDREHITFGPDSPQFTIYDLRDTVRQWIMAGRVSLRTLEEYSKFEQDKE